tara:strand:- start:105 stop:692 length:588 start_codon:yes stop_codon:yes gene_type:complete
MSSLIDYIGKGISEDDKLLVENIDNLDLDCIKVKLMDSDEETGWSREKVDNVEIAYKRFLYMSISQDTIIVPTKNIDKFWHTHILDTKKYSEDCEETFGFFLHHFPYFGMRGEQDRNNLNNSFTKTQEIYKEIFGDEYVVSLEFDEANDCTGGSCGAGSCGGDSSCHDLYVDNLFEKSRLIGISHRPTLDKVASE